MRSLSLSHCSPKEMQRGSILFCAGPLATTDDQNVSPCQRHRVIRKTGQGVDSGVERKRKEFRSGRDKSRMVVERLV